MQLRDEYQVFRSRLNNLLKKTKEDYYKHKLAEAEGDLGKIWGYVNEITSTRKNKKQLKELFGPNGETVTDTKQMANIMNNYYANVAQNLATSIPTAEPVNARDFPTTKIDQSIFLNPASEAETLKHIKSLNSSKSRGHDQLSAIHYKNLATYVSKPITHIINCCFSNADFPDICKYAHIIPLHKGGDLRKTENWRPISLVSTLSKIIEKAIKIRLVEFLNQHNFFASTQYGFLVGRSTQDAIIALTNPIYTALNNDEPCIALFLDLCKAFDTISHCLISEKLHNAGIRGQAHRLLTNYLSNRTHAVKLSANTNSQLTHSNDPTADSAYIISDPEQMSIGLPQGTILAPILFIIYINDFFKMLLECLAIGYCDDAAIVIKGRDWPSLEEKTTDIFKKIKNWLDFHKLSLNLTKTNYVTFSHRPANIPPLTISVNVMNTSYRIESKKSVKYLGVLVDNDLKWKEHAKLTNQRLRKTMYKFHQLRSIVSRPLIRQIYFGLVQSIAQYGIAAWGGTHSSTLKPISTTLNCIIKIALFRTRRAATDQIYSDFNVPNLTQLYITNLIKYVSFLNQTRVGTVHNIVTRQAPNLYTLRTHFTIFQHSPAYRVSKIYNNLPLDLKIMAADSKIFKKRAKKFIMGLNDCSILLR